MCWKLNLMWRVHSSCCIMLDVAWSRTSGAKRTLIKMFLYIYVKSDIHLKLSLVFIWLLWKRFYQWEHKDKSITHDLNKNISHDIPRPFRWSAVGVACRRSTRHGFVFIAIIEQRVREEEKLTKCFISNSFPRKIILKDLRGNNQSECASSINSLLL